jgi:hypothetical protein
MAESYLKEIKLPSRGKLYAGQIPDGVISIEPLGTREEKLFSAGVSSGNLILNKIFESCVTCPIDHLKLVLGDRLFILLQLRSITYGRQYDYSYQCDSCRKKAFGVADLDSLVIKEPKDVEDPSKFEVKLPLLKNELVLRLLTGEDEEKIQRYVTQVTAKSRGQASDTEYIYRLARRIDTINGETVGIREAMEFVENLKGADSLAIRDAMVDNDIGPDIDVTPACNHCGFEDDSFTLPLEVEFFRPRKRGTKPGEYLAAAERIDAAKSSFVE